MKIFITVCMLLVSSLTLAKNFKTEKWQTSQGTQVIFYQAMEVPMLDVSLAFDAGSARDGASPGLSTLTNSLINQGNAGLDADVIAESLESTGAQFDASTSRDLAVLNLRTLTAAEALPKAITIFEQIIARPDFSGAAFEREKMQQLMVIKQAFESPDDVANMSFFKALYKNHPYGQPVNGTKESVEKITLEQVKQFHKTWYVANNSILVIAGAISSEEAHMLAQQLTRNLPRGEKAPPIPETKPLTDENQINIPFPSTQTKIRMGQTGISHHTPEYFPLMVGNYILGGGTLVSILGLEIREKQGLTYGITSQFLPMKAIGPFIINLSTRNKEANRALALTRGLLKDFIEKGPNDAQLAAAKLYMTGNFALSLASNRSIANTLLRMAFYQLPDNYLDTYTSNIQNTTKDSIKKAFEKHLDIHKMLTVTVGQP